MPDTRADRVIDSIRADIAAGRLGPGDKLPSIARLAELHDVGVTTIKSALATLKALKLVRSEQGRGFYVV